MNQREGKREKEGEREGEREKRGRESQRKREEREKVIKTWNIALGGILLETLSINIIKINCCASIINKLYKFSRHICNYYFLTNAIIISVI